jgi:hypothetical protein
MFPSMRDHLSEAYLRLSAEHTGPIMTVPPPLALAESTLTGAPPRSPNRRSAHVLPARIAVSQWPRKKGGHKKA